MKVAMAQEFEFSRHQIEKLRDPPQKVIDIITRSICLPQAVRLTPREQARHLWLDIVDVLEAS